MPFLSPAFLFLSLKYLCSFRVIIVQSKTCCEFFENRFAKYAFSAVDDISAGNLLAFVLPVMARFL